MSSTTTSSPSVNTTITYSLDYYYAFFVDTIIVVRFYQIGYPITFILGFFGNFASLLTFSRRSLRRVSTGCLFIVLAVSDTLFLLICVIDFVEFGLQVKFYHHVRYNELCRFRSFVMYGAQVLSGWTLVTVSVDRWIRTRFPFKSGTLCTPKKALCVVAILVVVDVGLYSHLLTQLYGMLIPGFAIIACGPTIYSGYYFIFYFLDWAIVQILVISLLPVGIMLTILIDIFIIVRIRKRAAIQPADNAQVDSKARHQRNIQVQMFVLMVASIAIFLTTTLPIAIYKITSPRQSDISTSILQVSNIWVGLGWFQTLNYAINFYVHCLSSTLFRKEFAHQLRFICGKKQTQVTTVELTVTAQRTRHHGY